MEASVAHYETLPYQWHIPRAESTARNAIISIPGSRGRSGLQNCLQNCYRGAVYGSEVHPSSMPSRSWCCNFM